MKIIGLTGQSGAGKSSVAQMICSHGYAVINADEVYHSLIGANTPLSMRLAGYFGSEILNDGAVDRKTLARIVFSDPEALSKLNEITHRYVIAQTERIISAYEAEGVDTVFYDAPQLFEAGFEHRCEHIMAVLADTDIRIERICTRDGITREDARRRCDNQKTAEFFEKHCDILIYNNGDMDGLSLQLKSAAVKMGLKWEKQ